jgi:hypothetical protein
MAAAVDVAATADTLGELRLRDLNRLVPIITLINLR